MNIRGLATADAIVPGRPPRGGSEAREAFVVPGADGTSQSPRTAEPQARDAQAERRAATADRTGRERVPVARDTREREPMREGAAGTRAPQAASAAHGATERRGMEDERDAPTREPGDPSSRAAIGLETERAEADPVTPASADAGLQAGEAHAQPAGEVRDALRSAAESMSPIGPASAQAPGAAQTAPVAVAPASGTAPALLDARAGTTAGTGLPIPADTVPGARSMPEAVLRDVLAASAWPRPGAETAPPGAEAASRSFAAAMSPLAPSGTAPATGAPFASASAGPIGAAALPAPVDAAASMTGLTANAALAMPAPATGSSAAAGAAAPAGLQDVIRSLAIATGGPSAAPSTPADGLRERLDMPAFDALAPLVETAPTALSPRAGVEAAPGRIQFTAPIALPIRPELGLDDAFDQRIVWMAEQRIGQAEMRVSPDGMGPIDIRLQVDGHRVTAHFNAAHADVRQALEAGMDRLRDLLGQRGMELADAQVGQQRPQRDGGSPTPGAGPGDGETDGAPVVTTVRALRARGLVDEYV